MNKRKMRVTPQMLLCCNHNTSTRRFSNVIIVIVVVVINIVNTIVISNNLVGCIAAAAAAATATTTPTTTTALSAITKFMTTPTIPVETTTTAPEIDDDEQTTTKATPTLERRSNRALFNVRQTNHFLSDCGTRLPRREPRPAGVTASSATRRRHGMRTPKIIAGAPTREGQFPWQASLELLHPSLGFLGHWCGAVLIHQYWILSAAHCVHNDLFNLPIAPLWTVVLGEHNRLVETGDEQRIPVEKIVLHKRYQNFLHDLVLMKLSMPADVTSNSLVRRICLPFVYNGHNTAHLHSGMAEDEPSPDDDLDPLEPGLSSLPDNMDNFLRSAQNIRRHQQQHYQQPQQPPNITLPSMKELMSTKILSRLRKTQSPQAQTPAPSPKTVKAFRGHQRRRNDKLMRVMQDEANEFGDLIGVQQKRRHASDYQELPYIDCVATGWGKTNLTGDLAELLLKTSVPLHHNGRCRDAYGGFVKIHRGHLCAGKLNGKGGTCVGDSGGPLQCRLTKNGPWILAGITSFGSGCAIEGFPDVYTRTSYYMKWIQDTIAFE